MEWLLWQHVLLLISLIQAECFRSWRTSKNGITPSSITRATTAANSDMTTGDLIAINLPWGVISVRGPDRLAFLHGLGTNAFKTANVGSARYTSFVTAHGKLLSCVRCLVTKDDVKIICESDTLHSLLAYISSRIFPFDQVEVADESGAFSVSALLLLTQHQLHMDDPATTSTSTSSPSKSNQGSLLPPEDSRRSDINYAVEEVGDSGVLVYKLPASTELGDLGGRRPLLASLLCLMQQPSGSSTNTNTNTNGGDLGIAAAVRASLPSLLCDKRFRWRPAVTNTDANADADADADNDIGAVSVVEVWTVDSAAAASSVFDLLRIPTGRLVERDWQDHDMTALEAGLMHTIDFRKGCFVGQEAISKTLASARRNADGSAAMVRRRIARLRVDSVAGTGTGAGVGAVAVGDDVVDEEGEVVGAVLSAADSVLLSLALQHVAHYQIRWDNSASAGEVALESNPAVRPVVASTGPRDAFGVEAGTCLALLKTSYVVVDHSGPPGQLRIRSRGADRGSSAAPGAGYTPVREVAGAPFPTYDTAFSPAPPVEKVVPAVAAAADAAAAAKKATEEAARKEAKLAEMAKKVAALQRKKAGRD